MNHAIVILKDDTIASITLDKFLASQMTILEDCSEDRLSEKLEYWNRIYHPEPPNEPQMYHFFNKKNNKHVWSVHKDPDKALKGCRNKQDYLPIP